MASPKQVYVQFVNWKSTAFKRSPDTSRAPKESRMSYRDKKQNNA